MTERDKKTPEENAGFKNNENPASNPIYDRMAKELHLEYCEVIQYPGSIRIILKVPARTNAIVAGWLMREGFNFKVVHDLSAPDAYFTILSRIIRDRY